MHDLIALVQCGSISLWEDAIRLTLEDKRELVIPTHGIRVVCYLVDAHVKDVTGFVGCFVVEVVP